MSKKHKESTDRLSGSQAIGLFFIMIIVYLIAGVSIIFPTTLIVKVISIIVMLISGLIILEILYQYLGYDYKRIKEIEY